MLPPRKFFQFIDVLKSIVVRFGTLFQGKVRVRTCKRKKLKRSLISVSAILVLQFFFTLGRGGGGHRPPALDPPLLVCECRN